jgi:sugar phosphate isomerase/epimerase
MKLSFTTLGCPKWDVPTVVTRARRYGFDAVDFHGLGEQLDVTLLPEFTTQLQATGRMIREAGLLVSGVSSSIHLCSPDQGAANVEEARRTIPVVKALGGQFVRVYGGGDIRRHGREGSVKIAGECMRRILALPGASDVHWVLETHDHWIASRDCMMLLEGIASPNVGLLWDIGHSPRYAGESVDTAFEVFGDNVRYTHFNDCRHDPDHPQALSDGWRYVTPGTGDIQLRRAVQLLHSAGYTGYLTFEHQKRWHPEMAEPEQILPAFAQWARRILSELQ